MNLEESLRPGLLKAKEKLEEEFFNPKWRPIKPREAPRLMAQAMTHSVTNIVGTGIGEKLTDGRRTGRMAIRVYVINKVPKKNESELPRDMLIPKVVKGALTDEMTDVIAVGRPLLRQNSFYIRPAPGGVSIGNINDPSAVTLGCLVQKENDIFILSNNHVLARQNAAKQDEDIVQPGTYDGGTDVIAKLAEMKNVVADGIALNLVDAAIAKPIERSLVSDEIIRIGRPKGTIEPRRYRWVIKCGRTTYLTRGYIDDFDVTIQIPFAGGVAKFTEQILIWGVLPREYYDLPTAAYMPPFSDSGDSGSAVIDETTGYVVGLLFAGSDTYNVTYANKIRNVESELGVKVL